jgi:hypothetical protein
MGKDKGFSGIREPKLDLVKKSIIELFKNEKAFSPEDCVGLMYFREKVVNAPEICLLMPFQEAACITAGSLLPIEALASLKGEGGTPLGAGIRKAIESLKGEGGQSKGVMLVTDGSNSVGEDPRLVVYDALRDNVRIDIVGLGTSVDEPTLKPLAEKTGGVFRRVSDASELAPALVWQRILISLSSSAAGMLAETNAIKNELRHLEGAASRNEIDSQGYQNKKYELASKLAAMQQAHRERRAEACRELCGLKLEREKPMAELTQLNCMLLKKEIDKRNYIGTASQLEDKVARLNREIAARQQILDALG